MIRGGQRRGRGEQAARRGRTDDRTRDGGKKVKSRGREISQTRALSTDETWLCSKQCADVLMTKTGICDILGRKESGSRKGRRVGCMRSRSKGVELTPIHAHDALLESCT